ncbi:hypothetical protein [Streptomyces sp. NBC_00370]|uniref:hypothetical protein n=1 Tax=Streptomyces sp. NBC_00370 TaxID=2975728 RepID=UPI002E25E97D
MAATLITGAMRDVFETNTHFCSDIACPSSKAAVNMLRAEGPTGGFFDANGTIPW